MKQRQYPEEQIVGIVKKVEDGKGIAEVCRGFEVSEVTVYRWRKKYGGREISQLRRMRQLENENSQLKRIVAQQAIDIDALKGYWQKDSNPLGAPGGTEVEFVGITRAEGIYTIESDALRERFKVGTNGYILDRILGGIYAIVLVLGVILSVKKSRGTSSD